MSNSGSDYWDLYKTGQELRDKGLTLPDSTPHFTHREREIIEEGRRSK